MMYLQRFRVILLGLSFVIVIFSLQHARGSEVHDVPGIQQDGDNDCGPTAAASCLKWFQQNGYPEIKTRDGSNDIKDIKKQLEEDSNTSEENGTSYHDLVRAMNRLINEGPNGQPGKYRGKLRAKLPPNDDVHKNFDYLDAEFEKGQNILLYLMIGDPPEGHYVTVRNISGEGDTRTIEFMDPKTGKPVTVQASIKDDKITFVYDDKTTTIGMSITMSNYNTTYSQYDEANKKITYEIFYPPESVTRDLHVWVSDCVKENYTVTGLPEGWAWDVKKWTMENGKTMCYISFYKEDSQADDIESGAKITIEYKGNRKIKINRRAIRQTTGGAASPVVDALPDERGHTVSLDTDPPDAPERPGCLPGEDAGDQLALQLYWDISADPTVNQYEIYDEYTQELISICSTPEILLTGLDKNVVYTLTVAARNDDELLSEDSPPITFYHDKLFASDIEIGGQQSFNILPPMRSWHWDYGWCITIPGANTVGKLEVGTVFAQPTLALPCSLCAVHEPYYRLSSDADIHPGPIGLQITYHETRIIADESLLGLYGLIGGEWIDITDSIDTELNLIFGTSQELGIIAVINPNPLTPPKVRIDKIHDALQGHYQDVSITIENSDLAMGGFDFLIAYDASALTFIEAVPGQLLEDCGWEYFTYRYGSDGNCGDACPSGLLRIVVMAETNNGPNHPSCYGPPDINPHELVEMRFLVTNDRTFDCQYLPIRFFWMDCNDNAVSSVTGDTLYVSDHIYDFEGTDITDSTFGFPTYFGIQSGCLEGGGPDKPAPMPFIYYKNGGIDVICSDSIDVRGDINVNGIENEIADAVMFTNYFINGLSAFGDHVEASIAASDVNADGIALSVADLVYLVRIITGDAPPYPKVTPYAMEASVSTMINHSAAAVSTNSSVDIGAGYFVFNYAGLEIGEPQLIYGASEMTLKCSNEGGVLKVLVYSMDKGIKIPAGMENIFAIPIAGGGNIELTDVQLSDYFGNLLEVTIDKKVALPKTYALHQNYPNPFNAATIIIYELPEAAHVTIEVFNVLGQKVKTLFDRQELAGVHSISWDGTNETGTTASSGVYFYRISTPSFSAEKKMMLLK